MSQMIKTSLTVNGKRQTVTAQPDTPLLWVLREDLKLTGTKFGCGAGQCGACMVHVDGKSVFSCLLPVSQMGGRSITTIEGLAADGGLHPLQAAFIAHDGFQCGYCTPGQICSAVGMLAEAERGLPSAVTADLGAAEIELGGDELRERMSGNLCRCGAYNGIVAAIDDYHHADDAKHAKHAEAAS